MATTEQLENKIQYLFNELCLIKKKIIQTTVTLNVLEILTQITPLTGVAPLGYRFGIDTVTFVQYYVDSIGNWQPFPDNMASTLSRFGVATEDNLATQNRQMDMNNFDLAIRNDRQSQAKFSLEIFNYGQGGGLYVNANTVGLYGYGNLNGVFGETNTGVAGEFKASNGLPLLLRNNSSGFIHPMIVLQKTSSTVPIAGIGASIDWEIQNEQGLITSGKIINSWIDVGIGTAKSQFAFETQSNNVYHTLIFPSINANRYSPLSVNNNFADAAGNITIATNNYVDDTAAAAGGIPINGLYRTGSIVKIRVV